MNIKTCTARCAKHSDFGILLLRVAVGGIFLNHGISKLMAMDGMIQFFQHLGLNSIVAWAVALTETLGGIAIVLGIWTPLAGTVLAIIMLGVLLTAKWGKPIASSEFEILLLVASLGLVGIGSGKYSLAAKCNSCTDCDCKCHLGDKRCAPDGTCAGCGKK